MTDCFVFCAYVLCIVVVGFGYAATGAAAGLAAGVVDAGLVYFSSNWAGDGCYVDRSRLNRDYVSLIACMHVCVPLYVATCIYVYMC